MTFSVPNLAGGSPGPSGPVGPVGTGVYGDMLAVFVFSGVTQAFTAGVPQKIVSFGTNGLSVGVTPDEANDRLVITEDGDYEVYWQQTYTLVAGAGFTFDFIEMRINGTPAPEASLTQFEGPIASFFVCASAGGILSLSAGDVLEIYAQTSAGATVTWRDAQLFAWKARS